MPLFQEILAHIPQLQEFYALLPLGSRIGTDSTSRSHLTHGMGLVFIETLPPKARAALRNEDNALRLTLPVHTDIYRFTHYHEPAAAPTSVAACAAVYSRPWQFGLPQGSRLGA